MSNVIDGGVDDTPLEPLDRITVRLTMFGIEWEWTKPKGAHYYLAIRDGAGSIDLINELESGLPADTIKAVEQRLRDPDDALDTAHLIRVLDRLRELAFKGAGDRPTEPSSDSSQSPTDDGQN